MEVPDLNHIVHPHMNRQRSEPPTWMNMPEQPGERSWDPFQGRSYSKYNNVYVLLLQWVADNLGVNQEIQKLNTLLTTRYGFTTYTYRLPDKDAEDHLTNEILRFRKGRGPGDLLMVYYGGHAASSDRECTWIANLEQDSPRLNWLSVQNLLLEHPTDVLMILDCCFATHAARGSSKGDNWFLGASAKESLAIGVSWKSFTSAMTRQLERYASIYEDQGISFTVQTIHHELTLYERDLTITPVITRLTDHECPPTDLTPLPHFRKPRLRSAQTTPLYPLPSPSSGPSISHRSRGPHAIASLPGRSPAENDFLGLHCLYQSPNGKTSVDLVFVHGTDGHAIESFASHLNSQNGEASWPCVELAQVLEAAGIFPRIMTFGWAANAWLDVRQDNGKLGEASQSLCFELERERSSSKGRPIVFVGHGIGGLLIKQVVIDTINFGVADEGFENLIKACLFFAVPHHPTHEDYGFAPILAAMKSVLRYNKAPTLDQIESLRSQSQAIKSLSREFNEISRGYRINTRSFYELRKTGNQYIVPQESAILDRDMSDPIDANFRDTVQLAKLEPHLQQMVLGRIRDTIQEKLSPMPVRRPNPKREEILMSLTKYDTVFLIDDSDSMLGPRWSTVSKILARIASIAVKYDKNGVDIRFFNKVLEDEERLNLDSSKKVMDLFKMVKPKGSTPTGDVLETELGAYLTKFRKSDGKVKRLNLIVLTDGEPDDPKSVEDAIVKCAQQLERLEAHSLQVGVQFVQIGGDEEASKYLRGLDDDLKTKRKLDRDVSADQTMQAGR
jgi:hypothetical protein